MLTRTCDEHVDNMKNCVCQFNASPTGSNSLLCSEFGLRVESGWTIELEPGWSPTTDRDLASMYVLCSLCCMEIECESIEETFWIEVDDMQ